MSQRHDLGAQKKAKNAILNRPPLSHSDRVKKWKRERYLSAKDFYEKTGAGRDRFLEAKESYRRVARGTRDDL